jgi:chromosome segregation protein
MKRARVDALTEALDASRARAGVERLAEINGVAGTLAELVEVDEGYQAAFEAAAGEAMAAVIVDSLDVARAALEKLRHGDDEGAVLVLGQPTEPPGGAPGGESGVEALRPHVRGINPAVNLLLDRILCCCVVVDGEWQQALDLALKYPDLVTVTARGDRFSRNSWQVGTGGRGSTMAAVRRSEEEAAVAEAELVTRRESFEEIKATREELAATERETRRRVTDNERISTTATNSLERLDGRRGQLAEEIETIGGNITELQARVDGEQARIAELDERLPELEAAEASGEERQRLWREARGVLEEQSTELRKQRNELEVRANSLGEREQFLTRRLEALETRLEQHKIEVEQAAQRRERIQHAIGVISRLRSIVDERIGHIDEQLAVVREQRNRERARRQAVSDQLESTRKERSGIERELLQVGEKRQQFEVRQAEIRTRLEGLLEGLHRDLDVTEEVAVEADEPELPQGQTAKQRMAELERDLRQMGPINPLALEEFEQVKERHEFLDQQMQDIQESRRELVRVIRAVDAEIVEVFNGAFADVAHHFENLFGMLFPGGSGRLKLTDPENPLETGVEIEAKPSGKNVRTLTLLSGGERSLVAMAFLFAVFRSRPSPFYLLDEVEAALDDMNLSRFLKLVDEFREEAQLVIVSHQKRTMERADCMYGVSMQLGGSTKVVSQRIADVDLTKQSA